MKRIVSYSLFGSSDIYLRGAVRNARTQAQIYPGWTSRFYVSQEIPQSVVMELEDSGAEVVRKQRISAIDGMFWRFLPAGDSDVEAFVSRDVDSRLTSREFAAVQQWLASGKGLHIMRDHPCHRVAILGGMWGCRGGKIPDISTLIDGWKLWHNRGHDQDFLRNVVFERFANDSFVHSEFYQFQGEEAQPFPLPREGGEFVGCVYEPERDTLTEQQHQAYLQELGKPHLQQLSSPKRRPLFYLRAEQWLRTLRKRAA